MLFNYTTTIKTMYIDVYDNIDGSFMKRLSEEEIFNSCGRDTEMYDDFIRHIKTHPYVKKLHQKWIYNE